MRNDHFFLFSFIPMLTINLDAECKYEELICKNI